VAGSPSTTSLLAAARNATFISNPSEFLSIIGPKLGLNLVGEGSYNFSNEAGI
jgi:hypothetical protein